MTTLFPVEQICGVCGATSCHQTLASAETMGAPDLDMRPAPMARWTLAEQIQQCPECGYCSRDISVASETAKKVVHSEAYQDELSREDHPVLSRRYLCAALILSAEGDDGAAGRAALMGAWAADDAGDWQAACEVGSSEPEALAKGETLAELETPAELEMPAEVREAAIAAASGAAARCRRLAIGYFEADRRRGLTFAADEFTADALLADLYRRVGDFEAARSCAQAGIDRGAEGLVLEVLKLQIQLADFFDTSCHNMDEIGFDEFFMTL